MEKLYRTLKRRIRAVVVSNDNDEKIWELFNLSSQSYLEIAAYLDVKSQSWGGYYYKGKPTGIKVVSVGRAIEMVHEGIADIILVYSCTTEYDAYSFQNLIQFGVDENKIWFVPYKFVFFGEQIDQHTINEITPYMKRRELETIELHAAEHCNLNCKFCSMFCGLVKEPAFPDYEKTKRGLEELKKYITHVKKVRIIGGEPLLNPELGRYIGLVRSLYPYTNIRLITNGILVKSMSESLIETIKRNDVEFIVTGYQPLMDKHEEIHEFLDVKGIRHSIGNLILEFQKIYDYRGVADAEINHSVCRWKKSCATLYGGNLAPCFVPFVIHYLSDAFDLNVQQESGILDLYAQEMSSEKIHRFFDTPFDLCRYCSDKRLFAKWERIQPEEITKIENWSA